MIVANSRHLLSISSQHCPPAVGSSSAAPPVAVSVTLKIAVPKLLSLKGEIRAGKKIERQICRVRINTRLLLNLLLANMGLYFTALFTLIGAFLARITPGAAQLVLVLSIVVCLYSGVGVLLLTPRDWLHTLPRILAAVLIGIGLLIG